MRIISITVAVSVIGSMGFSSMTHAQKIYSCKDNSGHIVTSDRPLSVCQNDVREHNKDGSTKREIKPSMAGDGIKRVEKTNKEDVKEEVIDQSKQDEDRRNNMVRETYRTEKDIENARIRYLAPVNNDMKGIEGRLAKNEKEVRELEAQIAAYKGSNVPPNLSIKLDFAKENVQTEQAALTQKKDEMVRINKRFDDDLKRFKALSRQ